MNDDQINEYIDLLGKYVRAIISDHENYDPDGGWASSYAEKPLREFLKNVGLPQINPQETRATRLARGDS